MAQTDFGSPDTPVPASNYKANSLLRKFFGRANGMPEPVEDVVPPMPEDQDVGGPRRKVVPGLPRAQTFKRQQSERRKNLAPVQPTPAERRAVSVDRRMQVSHAVLGDPRASAPDFLDYGDDAESLNGADSRHPSEGIWGVHSVDSLHHTLSHDDYFPDESHAPSTADAQSITTSQYDAMIHIELERTWILNLSMHFRDRSKREKFFVTYRETPTLWRRVTISLDYRNAPENSLEDDLLHTKFQREKSAKIYEAIRESLQDIQFYDSVTNLKLQTTDGRLHVHVVEDVNEIIHYPTVQQVQHLGCRRIRERDIEFDSHMSGFVYKVHVNGQVLIKKEIPGPDTIDEFLYEINALSRLGYSNNVIHFYGVVVDDYDELVKGLLISYADQGALIDIIYDSRQESDLGIPWPTRAKWARQIVQGLSDIHECGFVQGDFTLSNIVIDENGDAKIIDINRRGCPVGWEPPEATPLIECNQRISMYIGVKSDLYQLGMVLWALATQEDEPEAHGRPLLCGPEVPVPDWYRRMVEICLSDDPRMRMQASSLLSMFPTMKANGAENGSHSLRSPPAISVDDGCSEYFVNGYQGAPNIRTVEPSSEWQYVNMAPYGDSMGAGGFAEAPYYHTRGRSPPSPLPSHSGRWGSPSRMQSLSAWAAHRDIAPSYSDVGHDDELGRQQELEDDREADRSVTPTTNRESIAAAAPAETFGDRLEKLQREIREQELTKAMREHQSAADGGEDLAEAAAVDGAGAQQIAFVEAETQPRDANVTAEPADDVSYAEPIAIDTDVLAAEAVLDEETPIVVDTDSATREHSADEESAIIVDRDVPSETPGADYETESGEITPTAETLDAQRIEDETVILDIPESQSEDSAPMMVSAEDTMDLDIDVEAVSTDSLLQEDAMISEPAEVLEPDVIAIDDAVPAEDVVMDAETEPEDVAPIPEAVEVQLPEFDMGDAEDAPVPEADMTVEETPTLEIDMEATEDVPVPIVDTEHVEEFIDKAVDTVVDADADATADTAVDASTEMTVDVTVEQAMRGAGEETTEQAVEDLPVPDIETEAAEADEMIIEEAVNGPPVPDTETEAAEAGEMATEEAVDSPSIPNTETEAAEAGEVAMEETADEPVNMDADELAEKISEPAAEVPIAEPAAENIEEIVEEPVEEAVEEPVEEAVEEPVEEAVEEPPLPEVQPADAGPIPEVFEGVEQPEVETGAVDVLEAAPESEQANASDNTTGMEHAVAPEEATGTEEATEPVQDLTSAEPGNPEPEPQIESIKESEEDVPSQGLENEEIKNEAPTEEETESPGADTPATIIEEDQGTTPPGPDPEAQEATPIASQSPQLSAEELAKPEGAESDGGLALGELEQLEKVNLDDATPATTD